MRNRDYYFDNAKFILIIFVVFGHLLRSFIDDNHFVYSLYVLIYSFHMPAFILIAGYFAKGYKQKGYIKKIAKKLVLPYFFFQTIYSIFYYVLYNKHTVSIDPFDPHWSLWFLLSLFFWNVLLYLFTNLNKRLGLLIAIAIGVATGYIDEVSNFLSLSRTFVFFPIFLLGFYLKKDHFTIVRKTLVKKSSLLIFAIVWLGFFLIPNIDFNWLQGSKSYASLGYRGVESGLIRLAFYGISFFTTFSFLSLIPTKNYFFTKWGTRTLYVYLLHGFFIKSFRNSDMKYLFHDPGFTLLLAFLALLVTVLLSSKAIKIIAQPFVEIKLTEIKRVFDNIQNSKLTEREN